MKKTLFIALSILCSFSALTAQTMSGDSKLRYANKIIERYYVDTVDTDHVTEEAIIAMLKTLDPHSQYSNAEETRELTEPLQGNFSGIGIQFSMLNDTIYVIQPVASGPCERVGIVAGDRIIAANDTILSGVNKKNSDVMKVLRGPKGTKVKLQIKRRGESELIDFIVTRDDIPISSIDASYIAESDIGYIKLSRFAENSAEEVYDAVSKLKKKGMKDLIIDLEYNGGGYLNAATELAEMLLNRGDLIVYTKGNKVPDAKYHAAGRNKLTEGKVVIMVNQYSASASEILSGAVQDHDRGVIVGRRTFGKGLVQRPFPFPDGSMIRLTVARYYTPSGRCIQKPYKAGDTEDYDMDILNRYNSGELSNADSVHVDNSERFETLKSHRIVYGGGGIMPDLFVPIDTTGMNNYSRDILAQGIYNSFCTNYIDDHRKELKKNFKTEDKYIRDFNVDDKLLSEFRSFAKAKGIECDQHAFDQVKPTIATIIKAYIGRDLFTQSTYYRIANNLNNIYEEALRIIRDDAAYNALISPAAQ